MNKHRIHKYKRTFLGNKPGAKRAAAKTRTAIWRCVLPDCQHYLFTETVIGKVAQCWKCGDNFEIKRIHLERVKPTCSVCRGEIVKRKQVDEHITNTIESVLRDMNLDLIDLNDLKDLKRTG